MKATAEGLSLDTCVLVSLFHNDSGYAAADAAARTQQQPGDADPGRAGKLPTRAAGPAGALRRGFPVGTAL